MDEKTTRLLRRLSDLRLNIDVAQQQLNFLKREKEQIDEETERTKKASQDVQKQLHAARERQLHQMQTLQTLKSQNSQGQKILEQNQDESRRIETAAQREVKHDSEKLKGLSLQHRLYTKNMEKLIRSFNRLPISTVREAASKTKPGIEGPDAAPNDYGRKFNKMEDSNNNEYLFRMELSKMIEELRDVGATIGFEDKNAILWESLRMPTCSDCLQGGCFERMSQTSQHNSVQHNNVDDDASNQNPMTADSFESSDFIWNSNDFDLPQLQKAVADCEEWE